MKDDSEASAPLSPAAQEPEHHSFPDHIDKDGKGHWIGDRAARTGPLKELSERLWQCVYAAAANEGSILHDDTVTAIAEAVSRLSPAPAPLKELAEYAWRWAEQGKIYAGMTEHQQREWFNGNGEALIQCSKQLLDELRKVSALSPQPPTSEE